MDQTEKVVLIKKRPKIKKPAAAVAATADTPAAAIAATSDTPAPVDAAATNAPAAVAAATDAPAAAIAAATDTPAAVAAREAGGVSAAFVEALAIDEAALVRRIAGALGITPAQTGATIALLKEECTVPFIARYRKERTGDLDEVQVRDIEHGWTSGLNMEGRRVEIIRAIFEQGKLTPFLLENIQKALTPSEMEDIYAPYKRKKKTRGMLAAERGLEPLAALMLELDDAALSARAADFVREDAEHPELAVPTAEDALSGAADIIAERVSQEAENRALVKELYRASGKITVKGVGDEEERKKSVYQMYWDYGEALSLIKPHRVLAINRGEREQKLEVSVDVDTGEAALRLLRRYACHNARHRAAVEDGLKRLLSPAVVRELRADAGEAADGHGIGVFSSNLKNLLMQRPIKGTRVLGVDPGIRTGTKCAALDETGKFLGEFKIYNHKAEEAKKLLEAAVKKYDIALIAVGNGTGSREVQEIVAGLIAGPVPGARYTIVDEDGASVYSASDIAREEFPDLDLTIRGAISIGRRLQDPLAELVKIDPKSIGVGLYQHDVNQKKLSETLDEAVGSVVNNVGVQLNTASASLLRYVSGISGALAKKIVKFRDEKGKITTRAGILEIPGMGPKTFEQCAGFLRIPESPETLDNTWVHPENYPIAREIQSALTTTGNLAPGEVERLKEKYRVGDTTIRDIAEELRKPGRDPREDCPAPIMRQGVVTFEDLREGMTVTGKIKNVVDFGAFVDVGIKETALVHISEMSDSYVKDPLELIKVGDVFEFKIIALDLDRRRISLSRKTNPGSGAPAGRPDTRTAASGAAGFRPKGSFDKGPPDKGRFDRRPPRDDDGSTYNAFAAAFQRMREREKKR